MTLALTRLGAQLPPFLKNRFTMKFFWSLFKAGGLGEITTNLGLSSDFKVQFSSTDVSPITVFGRPEHYRGERGALFLCRELLPHSDAFVDVGAHFGYFLYFLKKAQPEKPAYYFEPNPRLFRFINEAVDRNRLSNVVGSNQAIGAAEGETEFLINLEDESMSSLNDVNGFMTKVDKIKVDLTTFDRFLEKHPELKNVLVKVDIENCEFDFLTGALGSLDRIQFLVIEVLLPAMKRGFVKHLIEKHSLHAYYINDFSLQYSSDGGFAYQPGEINWLFCRYSPKELGTLLKKSPFKIV